VKTQTNNTLSGGESWIIFILLRRFEAKAYNFCNDEINIDGGYISLTSIPHR